MRSLGIAGALPRGASLVELVVALGLFGVVGAALVRALDRQARFHTGIVRVVETHAQLAVTHDAIAAELRGATSPQDVLRLSDTAIVYRTAIGTGIACAVAAGTVHLAPTLLASGQALARIRTAPQPGDTAWLHDEGASLAPADDAWHAARVLSATQLPGACDATPYVHPVADAGRPAWRLVLDTVPPIPSTVRQGTLVRVTRLARFALYRSSTGDTNLGWTDWNAAAGNWNVIQPVTGPFLPYNGGTPSASGVAMRASDSLGAPTSIAPGLAAPAAIAVITRAATTIGIRLDGIARGAHADSLRSAIALRNRP
jgi:hypothetical protein